MSKLEYENVLDARRKIDRGGHANDDDGDGDMIDDVAIASGNCRPNECDRNEWYDDVTTTEIAQNNEQ